MNQGRTLVAAHLILPLIPYHCWSVISDEWHRRARGAILLWFYQAVFVRA